METKICQRCKDEIDIELFNWRNKAKGTRQSYCKSCQVDMTLDHYKRNKQPYIDRNRRAKEKTNKFILAYLLSHPCVICGEPDPVLLDFDHANGNKIDNVSALRNKGSLLKTKDEIAKCQVLCVKCHRKKTAKENGHQAKVDEWTKEIKNGTILRERFNAAIHRPCEHCGKQFNANDAERFCSSKCSAIASRRVERPSKDDLEKELKDRKPFRVMAEKFGVTGNAIRGWIRYYGIAYEPRLKQQKIKTGQHRPGLPDCKVRCVF